MEENNTQENTNQEKNVFFEFKKYFFGYLIVVVLIYFLLGFIEKKFGFNIKTYFNFSIFIILAGISAFFEFILSCRDGKKYNLGGSIGMMIVISFLLSKFFMGSGFGSGFLTTLFIKFHIDGIGKILLSALYLLLLSVIVIMQVSTYYAFIISIEIKDFFNIVGKVLKSIGGIFSGITGMKSSIDNIDNPNNINNQNSNGNMINNNGNNLGDTNNNQNNNGENIYETDNNEGSIFGETNKQGESMFNFGEDSNSGNNEGSIFGEFEEENGIPKTKLISDNGEVVGEIDEDDNIVDEEGNIIGKKIRKGEYIDNNGDIIENIKEEQETNSSSNLNNSNKNSSFNSENSSENMNETKTTNKINARIKTITDTINEDNDFDYYMTGIFEGEQLPENVTKKVYLLLKGKQ